MTNMYEKSIEDFTTSPLLEMIWKREALKCYIHFCGNLGQRAEGNAKCLSFKELEKFKYRPV